MNTSQLSTSQTFDAEALRRGIEERDASRLLALYAEDAELHVVDRNDQPSHPKVIRGRTAIGEYFADVCGRDMTHSDRAPGRRRRRRRVRAVLPVPQRRARAVHRRARPRRRPDHPPVRRAGLGRVARPPSSPPTPKESTMSTTEHTTAEHSHRRAQGLRAARRGPPLHQRAGRAAAHRRQRHRPARPPARLALVRARQAHRRHGPVPGAALPVPRRRNAADRDGRRDHVRRRPRPGDGPAVRARRLGDRRRARRRRRLVGSEQLRPALSPARARPVSRASPGPGGPAGGRARRCSGPRTPGWRDSAPNIRAAAWGSSTGAAMAPSRARRRVAGSRSAAISPRSCRARRLDRFSGSFSGSRVTSGGSLLSPARPRQASSRMGRGSDRASCRYRAASSASGRPGS